MNLLQLNQPSKDMFLSVINRSNPSMLFTHDDIEIRTALPAVNHPRNTSVDVVGNSDKYRGRQRLHYNRFNLAQLFGNSIITTTDNYSTQEEALSLVADQYGVLIQPSDVFISEMQRGGLFQIQIRDSYLFNNNSTLSIQYADPELLALFDFEDFAQRVHNFANVTLPQSLVGFNFTGNR